VLDLAALATSLTGLVGWHPDPAEKVEVPPELLESRSGLYVQDASELLVLDVLQHLVPTGETLPDWLKRLQADALKRFVPALAAAQGLDGKVLLPETKLVKLPGNRADTVNKLGRFVGIQLTPFQKRGVAFALPRVSIQLDGVLTEPLALYLYDESQPDPVATFDVPATNKPYFPLEVPLDSVQLSGRAYLGYYEDDLPLGVRAIEAPVGPCGCPSDPYDQWSKYVSARPFSVPLTALEADRTLFDPAAVEVSANNYGLNLLLLSYCDTVGALGSESNQFRLAPLVQQAIAVRLFESIVNSPNVTRVTGAVDIQADALASLYTAQAKLYGGKVPGTDAVYPSALKALTLDLSGLDAACGPPAKPSLLSMGSLTRR
jgi:hypothetical protein